MKQRTDFWEKLEDDYANLGNAKRALSPDESLRGMSKPAPKCAVGLVLYLIGRREGLEEGIKPGLHQDLNRKEKA